MGQNQEAAKVLRKGSRLDGNGLRDRPAHDNARMASLLQLGGLYTQQGKTRLSMRTEFNSQVLNLAAGITDCLSYNFKFPMSSISF